MNVAKIRGDRRGHDSHCICDTRMRATGSAKHSTSRTTFGILCATTYKCMLPGHMNQYKLHLHTARNTSRISIHLMCVCVCVAIHNIHMHACIPLRCACVQVYRCCRVHIHNNCSRSPCERYDRRRHRHDHHHHHHRRASSTHTQSHRRRSATDLCERASAISPTGSSARERSAELRRAPHLTGTRAFPPPPPQWRASAASYRVRVHIRATAHTYTHTITRTRIRAAHIAVHVRADNRHTRTHTHTEFDWKI